MSDSASRKLARWRRRRASFLIIAAAIAAAAACTWAVIVNHDTGLPGSTGRSTTTITPGTAAMTSRSTGASSSPQPAPSGMPTRFGSAVTNDTSLVTIGDSIMAGYGLTDPGTSAWPVRLAAQTGAAVVNDSCSGAGFVAVGDCGTDYGGLIATATAAHPGLVIVQSSDNDLGQDPAELAVATTKTVQALHAAIPDTRLVGFSTLWDQPGPAPAEVAQSSADLQQALATVGGTFIDIGQPIAGKTGMLQSDDEHPTDGGQQALTASIAADLRAANV